MARLAFVALLLVAVAMTVYQLLGDGVRTLAPVIPGPEGASQALPVPDPGDTPPRGDLTADEAGRFLPTPDALRFFDSFLVVRDEMPEDVLLARLEAAIGERLPPRAAAEARALLDQYVLYLDDEAEIEPAGVTAESLERRNREVRELRRESFGPVVAERLFGDEERVADIAVARRRILDDPNLDDRERIAALAELQRQMPEEEEDALPVPGGSSVTDAGGGAEGAAPDPSASWAERMDAYRAERDRVLENVKMGNPEQRAYYLRSVRRRYFDDDEIRRVEALDQIEWRDRNLRAIPPAPAVQ